MTTARPVPPAPARRRGRSRALVLALLLTASGCGMSRLAGGELPPRWPIKPVVERGPRGPALTPDPRPTLLLRLHLTDEELEELTEAPPREALDLAPYRAALDSGLFSAVTTQLGLEGYAVPTDYTLDLQLRSKFEGGWYSLLGVVTLGGLPIVGFDEYALGAVVRDAEHRVLGNVTERDDETIVLWIPFLPLNMVSPVLPDFGLTTALGLNPTRWDDQEEALRYALVARLLDAAHRRFGFEVGGS